MNQEIIRFNTTGDVLLATNHNSYLLVSSTAMQEASPVFKELLSDIPKGDSETPIVDVCGYHAPSLNFACAVLHGKDPSAWQPETPLDLFHLAVSCRYYFECSDKVNWLIRILFEGFAFEPGSPGDIVDLLATAMVCKIDSHIKRLSKLLVYESNISLTTFLERESGAYVGKRCLESMEMDRLKLQQQFMESLPNILAPIRCENHNCQLGGFEVAGAISELVRIQMWPISVCFTGVGEALRRLQDFREPDVSVFLRKMDGWVYGCENPHLIRSISGELFSWRNIMENAYGGYEFHTRAAETDFKPFAVKFRIRTNEGFQSDLALSDCKTVDEFFDGIQDALRCHMTSGFQSVYVELPWAIGLSRALRVSRGDSASWAALLRRISESVEDTKAEKSTFVVNVCGS